MENPTNSHRCEPLIEINKISELVISLASVRRSSKWPTSTPVETVLRRLMAARGSPRDQLIKNQRSYSDLGGPNEVRPLHDRVVVKRIEAEEKSTGGIIIPDTAKEKPSQGEVIAVGPGGRDEAGAPKVTLSGQGAVS